MTTTTTVPTTAPARLAEVSDSRLEELLDAVLDERIDRDPLEHLYEIKEGARLRRSLCGRMWAPPFGAMDELFDGAPVLSVRGDCPQCAEVAVRHDTRIVEGRPEWLKHLPDV